MSSCKGSKGLLGVYGLVRLVNKWCHQICADAQNCALRYSADEGVVRPRGSILWYLFICSQLQRFLHNKMFRTKGILLVTTFLCFPAVISATCPRPRYSDLKDTLQSPGYSMGKYPANQSCTYDVRVPDGKRIILAFKSFDILGSMPHCPQDSLEIIVG